jgi:glycosyltransferase involved in cell wall biosynthesis
MLWKKLLKAGPENNSFLQSNDYKRRRKVLTIVTMGMAQPRSELKRLEENDLSPRSLLYEDTLDSDLLNENYFQQLPPYKKYFYRFMPNMLAQLLEAYVVRKKYEAVVTWSGKIALSFALLLKITRSDSVHVAMMTWISKSKQARLLRFVHSHIHKIIFWSSVQKNFAENVIQIPSSKLVLVSRRVDQKFWRPMDTPTDMICSVGVEMRDFPTLMKAMESLDIRCHIATGAFRGVMFDTVKAIEKAEILPSNISVGKMNYSELRDLYARSRFVVIPLHETESDNGVTTMEESMAMGKAVICTRTRGQVDHLKDGVAGIFVPPYDHRALREAIVYLWNHPEIAEQMGKEGRKYILANHTLDQFINQVKQIVDEVILENQAN